MTLSPEDFELLNQQEAQTPRPIPGQQRRRALGMAQSLEVAPKRLDAVKLSRETQVPWELVEENTDEVRAARNYEMLGPMRAENGPGWVNFMNSPLAAPALKNPENLRQMADTLDVVAGYDIPNKETPESLRQRKLRGIGIEPSAPPEAGFGSGWDRGMHMTELGKVSSRVLHGTATGADLAVFHRMRKNQPLPPRNEDIWDKGAGLLGEQAPIMISLAAYSATGAAAAGTIGVGSGPGALVFAAGGAVAGAAYGSYTLEGGLAYVEYLDMAEQIYDGGKGEKIDPIAIRGAAMLTGSLNAWLEVWGLSMLARWTGLSAAKRALVGELPAQVLKSRTLRPLLTRLGKSIAGSAASEATVEFLQESANITFGTLLVNSTTTQDRDLFTWENLERALEAAATGAFVGGSISVGVSPVVVAADRVAMNKAHRKREEGLDAFVESVRNGELKDADPKTLQKLFQEELDASPNDTNVYVKPEDLLEMFMSEGGRMEVGGNLVLPEGLEQLRDLAPNVLEQLGPALITGTDVVIPMADYGVAFADVHEKLRGKLQHGMGKKAKTSEEMDVSELEDAKTLEREMEALAAEGVPVVEEAVEVEGAEAAPLTPGERVAEAFAERLASESIHSSADVGIIADLLKRVTEVRAADPAIGERAFEEADIEVEGPYSAESTKPTLETALDRVGLLGLISDIREGRTPEARAIKNKHPILAEMKRQGGVATVRRTPDGWVKTQLASELAHMGVTSRTHPGLFVDPRKSKRGTDDAVAKGDIDAFDFAENEWGIAAEDFNEVYEAIRDELAGNPRQTFAEGEEIAQLSGPRIQLEQILGDLGIDPAEMTDEAILDALSRYIPDAPEPITEAVSLAPDDDPFFQTLDQPVESDTTTESIESELQERHPDADVQLYDRRNGNIELASLRVERGNRKHGVGTAFMDDLVAVADREGRTLQLEPASKEDEGTTSRSRLVKFYKRFGFVENKGRNKDYSLNAGVMFRKPKTTTLDQPVALDNERTPSGVTTESSAFFDKHSGEPVTFNFIRNTEKSPDLGSRFGQDVEPAGRYVNEASDDVLAHPPPGFETGSITFESPLYIEFGETYEDAGNWKRVLSDRFNATGEKLSQAIADAGYDGVVVVEPSGYSSEIVDLTSFPTTLDQPAFHGTPHRFDKFTLDHIGEGEGAQAFGWGLYFASRRGVANYYRETLSGAGDENVSIVSFQGQTLRAGVTAIGAFEKRFGLDLIDSEVLFRAADLVGSSSPEDADMVSAETVLSAWQKEAEAFRLSVEQNPNDDFARRMEGHTEESIEVLERLIAGGLTIERTESGGQLFEADIPESSELLDWDLPLSEQPAGVQAALRKPLPASEFGGPGSMASQDDFDSGIEDGVTAGDWFRGLESEASPESVSRMLLEAGIPGLQYTEGQLSGGGGTAKNFVIWDEEAINVLNTFFQPADKGIRGSLTYTEDLSKTVLSLSKSENLSTSLHELGHLFFVMMIKDAQTEGIRPQLQRDMEIALKYLGATSIQDLIKDPETGQLTEQGREFHERWARSFEAFLREGKAPTPELRDAFRRFRSWMLEVYRHLRGLNVELNDEMRGVYDRLLATEEAIAAAAEASPAQPAYTSQEQSGLSEAEYAAYEESYARIAEDAEEQLIAQVLREQAQSQLARAGNELERVREQAEADVRARPVAQLRYWLQRGEALAEVSPASGLSTENRKLDTVRVAQILGRSTKDVQRVMGGTGQYGMTQAGGQDPNIMAELWGFTSGEAMIRALYDSSNINQEIEAETDRRMRQGEGDPLRDGSLHARAQKLIDGDAKASFLMRQLRILGHQAGIAKNMPQRVVKDAAERIIDGLVIRDIRPGIYRKAEERAAQQVLDAVAAEDFAAAHEAGRKQLLNHYLAKQAETMKAESEKWRRFWSDFNKKALRKRLAQTGSGHLDAADTLLDRFDIRQLSNKQANINLGEWMMGLIAETERYNKNLNEEDGSTGEMLPVPQFAFRELAFDDAYRKHWRMLTVAEAKELTDALANIKHLALQELTIKLENEARDFLAVRDEVAAQITKTRRKFKPPPIGSRNAPGHGLHAWAVNYTSDHRKFTSFFHEMDGGYDGILTRLIVHPMDAAYGKEESMLLDAGEKLQKLFTPYMRSGFFAWDAWKRSFDMGGVISLAADKAGVRSPLASRTTDKKLVPGTANVELSQIERIMAVMNMGNAGNMQRLEDGYHWSRQDMAAILATMTKQDMDFIQGVWDFIETYWEEIAAIEKRRTGVKPQKITAVQIDTPFGTYRGGYFPAVYDGDQLAIAQTNNDAQDAYQNSQAQRMRSTTQDSFTKGRALKVKNQPMRLDFDVIFRHVGDVVHRLAFQDWAVNTGKLLADNHIGQTILEMYGPEVWKKIKDGHADVVRGEAQGDKDAGSRLGSYFRTGMAVSAMGMNLGTAILQPWGLMNAMMPTNLGPKWVAKGFHSWWRDFDSVEGQGHMIRTIRHIREVSPTMRNRLSATASNTREMREVASQLNKEGVLGPVRSKFFLPIIMMQATVDIPIWLGAYAKEMETGSGEESRAIAMADRMVINTQGSGRIGDLSAAQRQHKVFTLFMSFMNTVNDQAALHVRWARSDSINPMQLAMGLAALYMPYVFTNMMKDYLRDSWDEDESWAAYSLKAIGTGYLGGYTWIREATGVLEGYDYRGPAALGVIPHTAAAVKVLMDEDPIDERGVSSLIMATSVVTRVPGVQFKRWYELLMEDLGIELGTFIYGPKKD